MHDSAVVRRLRVGVVPGSILERLSVGYGPLVPRLLEGIHGLRFGRQPTALLVRGEWGSGKSHCLTFARHLARERGIAASMVALNARSSPLNYPQRFYPVLTANLEGESPERGLRPLLTSWLSDVGKRENLLSFSRASAAGELRWALNTLASRHSSAEVVAPEAEWAWTTLLGSDLSWGDYPYQRAKALDRIQALASMLRQVGLGGLVLTLDEAETIDQLWNVRSRLVAYDVLGRLTTMSGVWCIVGITARFARTVDADVTRGLVETTEASQPARRFLRTWQSHAFDSIDLPTMDRAIAGALGHKVAALYRAAYPASLVDHGLVAHCVELWSQSPIRNPRRLIRLVVHQLDLRRVLGPAAPGVDGSRPSEPSQGRQTSQGDMNAEQIGREFDRLVAAVPDLSGREPTKFHGIRDWLAGLLALRRERVNVKYLGTPNNVKNRLTESGGLQPDLTLAITQAGHVPLVFRTAQQLVKPGGVLKTVAVASRSDHGWKVVAVAGAPDTTIGSRLRDLFPEATVQ